MVNVVNMKRVPIQLVRYVFMVYYKNVRGGFERLTSVMVGGRGKPFIDRNSQNTSKIQDKI